MIHFDQVDAACTGPRTKQSGGFRTACPAHNGTDRNLSVIRGEDDSAVLKCHSQDCGYWDIVRALGIEPEAKREQKSRASKADKVVEYPPGDDVWVYRTEDGIAVLAVARWNAKGERSKRITQWRPVPGGWQASSAKLPPR